MTLADELTALVGNRRVIKVVDPDDFQVGDILMSVIARENDEYDWVIIREERAMSNNYVFMTDNQDLSQGDVLVVRRVQVSQEGVEVTVEKIKVDDVGISSGELPAPAVSSFSTPDGATTGEAPVYPVGYNPQGDIGVSVEDGINTQEKLG